MSATYFLLLTDHGSTRLAAAQAGTQPFQITHLAIGDANNLPYLPQSRVSELALVNEMARVPVQSVAVVGGQVEVVATVDSTIGGFNVHEIGLLDEAGQLLYIGNYHGGYKPVLTEGAGGDLELVCVLQTSNLTPVVVEMNPTVVTASRQWVLDNFVRIATFEDHVEQFNAHVAQNTLEHSNLTNLISAEATARANADMAHTAADNPHVQYPMKADFDGHVSDYVAHVAQNAQEHQGLANSISGLQTAISIVGFCIFTTKWDEIGITDQSGGFSIQQSTYSSVSGNHQSFNVNLPSGIPSESHLLVCQPLIQLGNSGGGERISATEYRLIASAVDVGQDGTVFAADIVFQILIIQKGVTP